MNRADEANAVGSGAAARIQQVRSPGGITAWLIEEPAIPLVAMDFAFGGGSAQEGAANAGLAALMVGMFDEGSGANDAMAFQELLEEHAIELRFSESRDTITGSLKTLVRHQAKAFELLRDALTVPHFEATATERIKAQLLAGLKRRANDPGSRASKAWFAGAFAGHAYALPEQGLMETIPTLSADHLRAAHTAMLTRDNLHVSVVGAITAAALAGILDEVFGGLPAKGAVKDVPIMMPQVSESIEIVPLDIPQSTIRFGMPGLLRKDDDFVAATVLNHVLGGGSFTSRLWQEVREKRGLAYSVGSGLYPFASTGLLMGSTATKNERAREALTVIRDEIARMATDGPTEEEVDKAKRYLIGSYALRFDTSTKIANQLLMLQVEDLGIDYMARRNGLFEAVTVADTQRVAQRLLASGAWRVTIAGKPDGL